ncbi:LysR family transcriptional regulator [Streptantibioticus parmotrematis]|uniref:LysR family transcriptional regulator n=1 Tax=Streptantibioticus parmotrematis TaxID=2873249 RepID=UPI0033DF44B0
MTDRISLRQLDYFVVAAQTGTMTGAARQLFVSQAAVSLGIAELERQLGVQLLLRSKSKGLTLTEAGRVLLPQARTLLSRTDELQAGLRDVGQTPAGDLLVGCFTTIAPFLLPGLLEEFQRAHPRVRVDFVEGSLVDLQHQLLDGRCEMAVLYGVDIQPGIAHEVLYATEPHVLLPRGHALARRSTVRLCDLADQDMIMLDVPPSMRYFTEVLADAGVSPRVRHRTRSFEMVRSLVARGFGYSLLIQRPALDYSYEGREVTVRPISDEVVPLPVVLARPAGSLPTRRAAAFAAFCHDCVARDPGLG